MPKLFTFDIQTFMRYLKYIWYNKLIEQWRLLQTLLKVFCHISWFDYGAHRNTYIVLNRFGQAKLLWTRNLRHTFRSTSGPSLIFIYVYLFCGRQLAVDTVWLLLLLPLQETAEKLRHVGHYFIIAMCQTLMHFN